MKMKPIKILLTSLCLSLLLVGLIFHFLVLNQDETTTIQQQPPKIYQGAVPENYDLDYYRETGKTRLLENKK